MKEDYLCYQRDLCLQPMIKHVHTNNKGEKITNKDPPSQPSILIK